ncbi:MAG: helicase C-terminal domain-containing protein, partial [Patescibacteria group bacterium]|nr:helicase C-terminal domain-containing protein [Patescibacteria group bacterium]
DVEQNLMVNYLAKRGHSVAFISGSHTDKERQSALNVFLNGNVQYLVAKMKVLKYSINLPIIDYCITTSLTHSFDDYDQFKGRIKRATGNQEHRTVFQIPMIAENTVSEPIFRALENKEDVSQAVLNYLLRN